MTTVARKLVAVKPRMPPKTNHVSEIADADTDTNASDQIPKKGAPRGPSAKRAVHPNFARHQFGSPHRAKPKAKKKAIAKTYMQQRNGY